MRENGRKKHEEEIGGKRRRMRKMDWPTAVNACDSPQIKKEALRLTRREKGGNDSKVCWNQTIRELGKLEGRLR